MDLKQEWALVPEEKMAGIRESARAVAKEAGRLIRLARRPPVRKDSPSLGFALMPTDLNPRIVRKRPRKAAPGRILFDAQGRVISVRNAPTVRRLRRR